MPPPSEPYCTEAQHASEVIGDEAHEKVPCIGDASGRRYTENSMTQVLLLLFAASFTYVVSLGAGKMLIALLRLKLYRSEEFFFGFVLGSAMLSTLVFALTAARLAYRGVFLASGLAIIALAAWRGAYRFSAERLPPLDIYWRIALGILYTGYAILYLKSACSRRSRATRLHTISRYRPATFANTAFHPA
jgi:hypothetical protein